MRPRREVTLCSPPESWAGSLLTLRCVPSGQHPTRAPLIQGVTWPLHKVSHARRALSAGDTPCLVASGAAIGVPAGCDAVISVLGTQSVPGCAWHSTNLRVLWSTKASSKGCASDVGTTMIHGSSSPVRLHWRKWVETHATSGGAEPHTARSGPAARRLQEGVCLISASGCSSAQEHQRWTGRVTCSSLAGAARLLSARRSNSFQFSSPCLLACCCCRYDDGHWPILLAS